MNNKMINDNLRSIRMTTKALAKIVFLLSIVALSGCSTIKPWVKPYERQNLADPIMAANRDPVSSAYLHHVYEAREGSRGAAGSGGGGCGCN